MYKNMLNLKASVVIRKMVETNDGFGAVTTVTTLTTLTRAAIWQAGGNSNYLSDKIYKDSTHVLAILPAEYAFIDDDSEILYDSKTFRLVGHEDDVSQVGKVKVIGMERLT